MARVHELQHPVAAYHLAQLRSKDTPPEQFRRLVGRLATLLAYQATSDVATVATTVQTPMAETEGAELSELIGLVPILRADLGLVLDPMLATGGSAIAALEALQAWGVGRCKLLSIIAAPEGVAAVSEAFPDAEIHLCAIDQRLNDVNFIVPGLGDAGDRIFNT